MVAGVEYGEVTNLKKMMFLNFKIVLPFYEFALNSSNKPGQTSLIGTVVLDIAGS